MYKVQKILNKRESTKKGKFQYLVKWKGWAVDKSTWEPEANLKYVKDMINEFQKNGQVNPLEDDKNTTKGKETTNTRSVKKDTHKNTRSSTKFSEKSQQKNTKTAKTKKPKKAGTQEADLKKNVQEVNQNLTNEKFFPEKNQNEPNSHIQGMKIAQDGKYWYYIHEKNNEIWRPRSYIIENMPIKLIEFYEKGLTF